MTAPQPPERCAGCGEVLHETLHYFASDVVIQAGYNCGAVWRQGGWITACLAAFHLAAAHRAREQALVAAVELYLNASGELSEHMVWCEVCADSCDDCSNYAELRQTDTITKLALRAALAAAEPAPPTSRGEHEAAGGKAGGGGDRA